MDTAEQALQLEIQPLTEERWSDLETLFGTHGAYGNCWCMWWRLSSAEFGRLSGGQKRQALLDITTAGAVPGILAYHAGEPVGWCSLAPREQFGRLERSTTLKRIDSQPVWSVVCFYVAKPYRRHGVMVSLLKAAVAYARAQGARIVEGYPNNLGEGEYASAEIFTGLRNVFEQVGFSVASPATGRRVIMRYLVKD